jgi:hypothetical protein
MGRPPTAQLWAEKWGQKNPRTPGLAHLFDPIFLTTSADAAPSRLFFAVFRPLACAKAGSRKEAKNRHKTPP